MLRFPSTNFGKNYDAMGSQKPVVSIYSRLNYIGCRRARGEGKKVHFTPEPQLKRASKQRNIRDLVLIDLESVLACFLLS